MKHEQFRALLTCIFHINGVKLDAAILNADDLIRNCGAEPKSGIVEEMSLEDRTITVYPCPKCGNEDPDWDRSFGVKVTKIAEQFGWDGMCPLLDWLGDCLTDLEELKKRAV